MQKNNKTYMAKKEDRQLQWYTLDAKGKTLGRFASEVAKILRGKHKPTFTPHADMGDGVIVINAESIEVTGSKEAQKNYYYYTGYIGGLREISYQTMKAKKPEYILEHAIKGMMPKTKLGKAQLKRLKLYAGDQHNLKSQKPISAEV